MTGIRSAAAVSVAAAVTTALLHAQPPANNPNAPRNFIKVDSPLTVLTHVRVIDGTGAPARDNQTIVIRDGKFAEIGDAARITLPPNANIIDVTGRTALSLLPLLLPVPLLLAELLSPELARPDRLG